MQADWHSAQTMRNVLATIFARTKAYAYRMIFLNQDYSLEQTARIRHYDIQCEGAQLIGHILKTGVEKQKMQAFVNIKSHGNRRFKRTNSPRAKSTIVERRRAQNKESSTSSSVVWYRPNSSCKSYNPSKKNELSQIFSRVKLIANSLTEPQTQKKTFFGKQDQNNKISSQIFTKIEQLESNLQYLVQKKSKLGDTAPSIRKTRDRQKYRNVHVEKFDIYI